MPGTIDPHSLQSLVSRAHQLGAQACQDLARVREPESRVEFLAQVLILQKHFVIRARRHASLAFQCRDGEDERVRGELAEMVIWEERAADWIAARLVQLGGNPTETSPSLKSRLKHEYFDRRPLVERLAQDSQDHRQTLRELQPLLEAFATNDPETSFTLRRWREHRVDLSRKFSKIRSRLESVRPVGRSSLRISMAY